MIPDHNYQNLPDSLAKTRADESNLELIRTFGFIFGFASQTSSTLSTRVLYFDDTWSRFKVKLRPREILRGTKSPETLRITAIRHRLDGQEYKVGLRVVSQPPFFPGGTYKL